jgi:hypothetical protein
MVFNLTAYSAFLFRLDNVAEKNFVKYPQLPEMLARVGSIMSVLLSVGLIAIYINQRNL